MPRQNSSNGRRERKNRRSPIANLNSRNPSFESLESRNMLSATTSTSIAFDVVESSASPEPHLTMEDLVGDLYETISPAAAVADEANPLTIILDFIDPGQPDQVDTIGNLVTTFDVESYGFDAADYGMVTESVLEQVRSYFYDIATDDVFPQSAIPAGMELNVQFFLGDLGVAPLNGSQDYYYVLIGTGVSGPCAVPGVLGCANLSSIRNEAGSAGAPVGTAVGSIFSNSILTLDGSLGTGDLETTTNALAGTTAHEIGHAVSLNHVALAGSVSPNGLPPIMGTGAIDFPNNLRLGEREFVYSANNPQMGNQEQFHIDQLVSAIGLTEAGTGPRGSGFIVSTLVDEFDGDYESGDLSLREAIFLATQGASRTSISFDESLAGGTINLDTSLGSLVVPGPVVIEGFEGIDQITITAPAVDLSETAEAPDGQIFIIDYSGAAVDSLNSVEMTGLILTGADAVSNGGAIHSQHDLLLTNVDLISNSTTNDGGAVYTTANLELYGSSLMMNEADDDGGAIYTTADFYAENSTISDNSTGDEGGAFAVRGLGTSLTLRSSTISGNTSVDDGGAIHMEDLNPLAFRIEHSTVFDNTSTSGTGGGIYMYNGVLVLEHTILAGNTDALGEAPDLDNLNLVALPAVLSKYSLIGNDQGSSITDLESSIIGSNASPVDPMLDVLADNGGPTMTHKTLAGSPAIDGGDDDIPLPPEFDQRGTGFERIAFGVIDIGALESNGFVETFTVDILTDENDGDFSEGDLSLREAILLSSTLPGVDLINFNDSLAGGTISLAPSLGELVIDAPMTIDAGDLVGGITIDASATDATPGSNNGDGTRVFTIDDGDVNLFTPVELIGLTLTGGDVNGAGGAIHSVEPLTVRKVSVLDNAATTDGGGIYHSNAFLHVENSTIANNYATLDGGGIFSDTRWTEDETGQIIQSTISTNTAGDEGGGIFNYDGTLEIAHSTITLNVAELGSGVVSFGDPFTETFVYSTIIADNDELDVQRSKNTTPTANTFVSLGYNVIGFGNAIAAFEIDPTDQSEISDPLLGPLTNNGGNILSHLPLPNSPVIDAGNPILAGRSYDEEVSLGAPVLYWKLDEEDSSIAVDSTRVEIAEGVYEEDDFGIIDSSLTLNRPGAGLQTGTSIQFLGLGSNKIESSSELSSADFGDTYSINLWFNADATTTEQTLLELEKTNGSLHASLELLDDGRIQYSTSNDSMQSNTEIESGEWYQVTVVQDGADTHLYINGILENTTTLTDSLLMSDITVRLGIDDAETSPFFGLLDELIIYGSAISSENVEDMNYTALTEQQLLVDQRGGTNLRVLDGNDDGVFIIDVGAIETPPPPPDPDFDDNNSVNGSDFMTWLRGFGTTSGATNADGDSDYDGDVDGEDLENVLASYGTQISLPDSTEPVVVSAATPASSLKTYSTLRYIAKPSTIAPAFVQQSSLTSLLESGPSESLPRTILGSEQSLVTAASSIEAQILDLSSVAARLSLFSSLGESHVDKDFDKNRFLELSFKGEPVAGEDLSSISERFERKHETEKLVRDGKASSADLAFETWKEFGLRGVDPFET